jgi:drug/metabolite transporter (DMT)-like permease
MLLWAVCFPLITVGIEYSPHLTFASLRAFLAGAVLMVLAVALRRPMPQTTGVWFSLIFVGLGATSLGFLGMFHAAELVTPGIATVIANTQPLLAAILAGFVLNERLTRYGKVALLLCFAGILMLASPQLFAVGGRTYMTGVAYIILAALGITISNVLMKRIAGQVDVLMAMALQMLIGSVPLMFAAIATEEPLSVVWSPTFVVALLALSLPGTAFVYWLWFSVLGKVQLGRANTYSFLVPVFGLTIGALFFGETLDRQQMAGFALTVFGVALMTRRGVREPDPSV